METLYTKVNMKDLLAQGLYLIMQQKNFEKITIKQICDKTGVIRGTFYHYFCDKYEALEHLTYLLLIDQENEDIQKIVINIFESVSEHWNFFSEAFKIEGQNNFEEILEKIISKLIIRYCDSVHINVSSLNISEELFYSYFSHNFVFILKYWITKGKENNPQQMYNSFKFLMENSVLDIINK